MAGVLTQSRLSAVDLHGLTETITSSIIDATSLQQSFQARLIAAQDQQRLLEANRLELEAQLARNEQDLQATALEIQESERAVMDCEQRIGILRMVEQETEDTKQRALEELRASVAKIPPEGANLIPPGGMPSTSRAPAFGFRPGAYAQSYPITEQRLAADLRRAIGRVAEPNPDGGAPVHPNDLEMIRQDIRALIRGRAVRR